MNILTYVSFLPKLIKNCYLLSETEKNRTFSLSMILILFFFPYETEGEIEKWTKAIISKKRKVYL